MSGSSDDGPSHYLRTELLERIAHELRGPAGVTLGALDELEHALGTTESEQHRLLFAMARRGAKRVLRTAERLTRTAQLELGQLAAGEGAPSDLRNLVKQAVEDAQLIEGRSSVKVSLRAPEEPCMSVVDSGWLGVALDELVAQAIRCARRDVDVQVTLKDEAVVVQVCDDRAAIMELPTERFVSVKDRRDASLGWPLVCDVARAHAATLSREPLRDAAGALKGQRITVELPRAT